MACIDPNCNTGCSCNNCCPPTPPIPTPTPPACVGTECTELYDSSCITYTGVAIPCLEITQGMNLTTVIQNMASKLCETCVPQPPFVCPDCVGTEIEIGTQIWTQCNATHTTYSDGITPIPEVTDETEWLNLTTGAWCYYNNDPANGAIHGKLYNWYAVAGIYDEASLSNPSLRKQFAPPGYHVPSDTEWTTLSDYLDAQLPTGNVGGKLKTTGTIEGDNGCWLAPNEGATNSSGFKGQPGGYRYQNVNSFAAIYEVLQLWSSTEFDINIAKNRTINTYNSNVLSGNFNKYNGFSVRLIKDEPPSLCPPEYINYDVEVDKFCNLNVAVVSVDFHVLPGEVLAGSPLVPCRPSTYPDATCPLGTIEYSINGGSTITVSSIIWGDGLSVYPYLLACEVVTAHLESRIDVSDYIGQTITIDYNVTYPSTPPLVINESVVVEITSCP